MTVYDQIIERIKQTCPEKLIRLFRHPDGRLIQFSYYYEYIGEYDGPKLRHEDHVPIMPQELVEKVKA